MSNGEISSDYFPRQGLIQCTIGQGLVTVEAWSVSFWWLELVVLSRRLFQNRPLNQLKLPQEISSDDLPSQCTIGHGIVTVTLTPSITPPGRLSTGLYLSRGNGQGGIHMGIVPLPLRHQAIDNPAVDTIHDKYIFASCWHSLTESLSFPLLVQP